MLFNVNKVSSILAIRSSLLPRTHTFSLDLKFYTFNKLTFPYQNYSILIIIFNNSASLAATKAISAN